MAERAQPSPQPLDGDPVSRVIVAGASGLAGALAADLVWHHPKLELARASSRSDAGTRICDLHPRHRVPMELTELDVDAATDCDAAIVAYPHGAAAPVVAGLRELGLIVVDLSADFRLRDPNVYADWYGELAAPELLGEAVYGLPELYRDKIRSAELVANPGCYPTATILTLAPLAAAGLIADVVVDAKSGVSGAGRGGGDRLSFVSLTENAMPYGTAGHRHEPEIAQELAALSGSSAPPLTFVPHLLPIDQGELVSCYVRPAREVDAEEVRALYAERYAGEEWVEVLDERPPSMREVRESNLCRIHVDVDRGGRILAFGSIDNLWKGAAGQAIQNLNLMLGIDENLGLG
ncbi:MAG: N-acetyl-gamma-glutamyl-phosphate reductase [Solirubrobacterales bacterium]|nr:N-acetyl-gamma-glutamyl-phosphate reductase [Solirubrobacterales bacterium]